RTDPPSYLPLCPQPLPGVDPRGVLRPGAPDLVPRPRPNQGAGAGGARPRRASGGNPRRRRRPGRGDDAPARAGVRRVHETSPDRRVSTTALPPSAQAVVIGAGIVGNSMAYHLSRLG